MAAPKTQKVSNQTRRKLPMSSTNLIRWSGLAALVGGVLFIVLDLLESLLFGNLPYAEAAATSSWVIVEGAYIVAAILISLGLVGLYAYQAKAAGTLGLVAFVVAFIGGMMAAGSSWSETFFGAWLAEAAPELLAADPAGALAAGVILSYVLFALGWLLFGLASLRAGVLPRGAAVLLLIGAAIFPVLAALTLPFAAVVYGVAVAWMGYALWSGTGEPALVAEAAR
jgi:hypothetical protein